MLKQLVADTRKYYITILENDADLQTQFFNFGLFDSDSKIEFFNSLVEILFGENKETFNVSLFSGITANEFYDDEYQKFLDDTSGTYVYSSQLYQFQQCFLNSYNRIIEWNNPKYRPLYVQLIITILYGNIKNYFFENRSKFLPEYDWFLINSDEQRKAHIEAFFKEFDKFSTIIHYVSSNVDIDEIPDDYIACLSAFVGLKLNDEDKLFDKAMIRNLTKSIITVYKAKGSLFAFEVFFSAIGIDVSVKETYFDRRLYWYSQIPGEEFNPITNSGSKLDYEYYLTYFNPANTYYSIKPEENVTEGDMSYPKTYSAFTSLIKEYGDTDDDVLKILGYKSSDLDTIFTYFKTNTIIVEFSYFNGNQILKEYQDVLKKYVKMMLPIYVNEYYPQIAFGETTQEEGFNLNFRGGDGYDTYTIEYQETDENGNVVIKRKEITMYRSVVDAHTIIPRWYDENDIEHTAESFAITLEDDDKISFVADTTQKGGESFDFFTNYNKEIDAALSKENLSVMLFSSPDNNIFYNVEFVFQPETELVDGASPYDKELTIDYYEYGNNIEYMILDTNDDSIEINIKLE